MDKPIEVCVVHYNELELKMIVDLLDYMQSQDERNYKYFLQNLYTKEEAIKLYNKMKEIYQLYW